MVRGHRDRFSVIREVLTEYQGWPGVFYRVQRWNGRRMLPVVVSWLEVVYFSKTPDHPTKAEQREEGKRRRRGRTPEDEQRAQNGKRRTRKRRDVTADMDELFTTEER